MRRSPLNSRLRLAEFLVSGVLVHLVVTIIIFRMFVGRGLTAGEFGLAVAIIIPFSALTEFVIDHPRFWHRLFRMAGNKFDDMDDLVS
ncbi:MAG TPA: hypothetical protein VD862_02570 [Candidatus Paceibacterota bacterium]|nr:hypothetical protein [Candidatus Paceibacterota bacterium]